MNVPERELVERTHAYEHWLRVQSEAAIAEAIRGISKHGPIASMHEGYAILKEEVDELWHELKSDNVRAEAKRLADAYGIGHSPDPTYMECIQIAAVALRLAAIQHRKETQGEQ